MSKALSKVGSEKQIFSILEAQLKRQDEQGKTIHTMFDGIKSMYNDFSQKFEVMTEMVQEVRDSVTLNDAERTMLQSDVAVKSIELAKHRYHEEEDKFSKVVGSYRRMIWKQLKEKYQVPKYHCIRRVDYEDARTMVQMFRPEDYI
jgi:hypothetical protein